MVDKEPIIGQEAIVPGYGLGRVVSFDLTFPHEYIRVRPYICNYEMDFAPHNVELIDPRK
jgi:hypothetical protein